MSHRSNVDYRRLGEWGVLGLATACGKLRYSVLTHHRYLANSGLRWPAVSRLYLLLISSLEGSNQDDWAGIVRVDYPVLAAAAKCWNLCLPLWEWCRPGPPHHLKHSLEGTVYLLCRLASVFWRVFRRLYCLWFWLCAAAGGSVNFSITVCQQLISVCVYVCCTFVLRWANGRHIGCRNFPPESSAYYSIFVPENVRYWAYW